MQLRKWRVTLGANFCEKKPQEKEAGNGKKDKMQPLHYIYLY